MKFKTALVFGMLVFGVGLVVLIGWTRDGLYYERFDIFKTDVADRVFKVSRDREAMAEQKRRREGLHKKFVEVTANYPELEVVYKDVADEDNGFLQWLDFMDRYEEDLDLPDEIAEMIAGRSEWDAAAFEEWLEDNKDLMHEILTLGLLPSQSVKGIDPNRYEFIGARIPKQSCDLLLARARLAMEQGDDAIALSCARSVMGTAAHLDQVETPTFLMATVAILLRQVCAKEVQETFLADGLATEDLQSWREILPLSRSAGEDLAKIYLGEFHVGMEGLILPMLTQAKDELPDPELFIEAYGAQKAGVISDLLSKPLAEIQGRKVEGSTSPELSAESQALLLDLSGGLDPWIEGWVRAERITGLRDAAFAIALGEEIPTDAATGLPFLYDEESGEVSLPTSEKFPDKEESVTVPRVKKR